jgi:hypothetical protein
MGKAEFDSVVRGLRVWNAGRKVGAKRALKPGQVWAIRFFLDQHQRLRDRVLFDLAIDSKLRGCDVVKVKIGDPVSGGLAGDDIVKRAKVARAMFDCVRRLVDIDDGSPESFRFMRDVLDDAEEAEEAEPRTLQPLQTLQ